MQFKKSKTFLAAVIAAAMTCSAVLPTAASAAGTRTKTEAYGDSTYAARFMSLYDDVVTNGVSNGYMSSTSTVSGGLGVPYHSAEELCIEAPDYGHETTSEALSYLVWVAAMRDNIVNDANNGEVTVDNTAEGGKNAADESVGDLAKAWKTMESTMIPDVQSNVNCTYSSPTTFMSQGSLSATYSDEWEDPSLYPTDMKDLKASNPLHTTFTSVASYKDDEGLYLMHWLADVDDWYGFGSANGTSAKQKNVSGSFTLINTFQRGEQESCWETIPHACVDMHNKGYGLNGSGGMKGFFNTESSPAEQFSYTNAPDAEDRAIQAVYAACRWGVGNQTVDSKWDGNASITDLAGKMGDETRNNMYDKYYKQIGIGYGSSQATNYNSYSSQYTQGDSQGKHYLMNWYTSWGGGLSDSWAWQIGASHMHEFYQNPLAAYGLLNQTELTSGMKSSGAVSDFTTSLSRQLEMYLWLLSEDGPIAGGCTNSYKGRYAGYAADSSTFYGMLYVEHPVYADPGSNHWIGNQVWAMQRLAELYYVIKQGGSDPAVGSTGLSASQALEKILDRWVGWFMDNTILGVASETTTMTAKYEPYDSTDSTFTLPVLSSVTDDGKSFSIPSSLIWSGEPKTWTGSYQENTGLTCTIVGYGDGDLGCVSSLANTLLYYAAARGVQASDVTTGETLYKSKGAASSTSTDDLAKQSLYLAQQLLDREWSSFRDDMGLGVSDHNTNLYRLWDTEKTALVLPNGSRANGDGKVLSASRYTGTMPNGDQIKDGVSFYDIRSNYKNCEMYQQALAYEQGDGEDNDGDGKVTSSDYYFTLHRFWHEGDIMMALGAMYELYPDMVPTDAEATESDLTVDKTSVTVNVGDTETVTATSSAGSVTFESADTSIATVDESGVITGVAEGTTTVTVSDGQATKTVAVTVKAVDDGETLVGDVDVDGDVDLADSVMLNKAVANAVNLQGVALKNADTYGSDNSINSKDAAAVGKFLTHNLTSLPEV